MTRLEVGVDALDVDEHLRAGVEVDVAEAQIGGRETPKAERRGRVPDEHVPNERGAVERLAAVQETG